jgi:hypothetical protein
LGGTGLDDLKVFSPVHHRLSHHGSNRLAKRSIQTMGSRHQHHGNQPKRRSSSAPPTVRSVPVLSPKPKVVYGQPIVLLEDIQKNVFIYRSGQWVQFDKSIAECRVNCQVTELSQKIKGMTRYEVCEPIE